MIFSYTLFLHVPIFFIIDIVSFAFYFYFYFCLSFIALHTFKQGVGVHSI